MKTTGKDPTSKKGMAGLFRNREIIEEEGSLPTFVLISLGSSSSCLKCK
jgi:hypothetical protein